MKSIYEQSYIDEKKKIKIKTDYKNKITNHSLILKQIIIICWKNISLNIILIQIKFNRH